MDLYGVITKKEKNKEPKEDKQGEKQKNTPKRETIKRIALLGERNSGTRWMSKELERCFPDLKVTSRLLRWKHWFQHDDGQKHNPTLVVAQFRNVYDWVESMRHVPHHSPLHVRLPWQAFVTTPWTMPRPVRDLPYADSTGPVCYEKFQYNQIVSCIEGSRNDTDYRLPADGGGDFSGHKPIYELRNDGSGEPYASILGLRADKILNFLDVKKWPWVTDVIHVQYEALLERGTEFLIKEVEEKTGIKSSCTPNPPQQRRKRPLDKKYVKWMTDHVHWDVEELIGYKPM